jgi:U3 small nucleolar RNA-associated protein 10
VYNVQDLLVCCLPYQTHTRPGTHFLLLPLLSLLLLHRSCRVHVYNVQDLLVCCLPYHATPEFALLVALLQLKGSAWEWLGPCQQSGAPPPRELLVRRCVNDQVRC